MIRGDKWLGKYNTQIDCGINLASKFFRYLLALLCGLKNKEMWTLSWSRHWREEDVPERKCLEGAAHELEGETR